MYLPLNCKCAVGFHKFVPSFWTYNWLLVLLGALLKTFWRLFFLFVHLDLLSLCIWSFRYSENSSFKKRVTELYYSIASIFSSQVAFLYCIHSSLYVLIMHVIQQTTLTPKHCQKCKFVYCLTANPIRTKTWHFSRQTDDFIWF